MQVCTSLQTDTPPVLVLTHAAYSVVHIVVSHFRVPPGPDCEHSSADCSPLSESSAAPAQPIDDAIYYIKLTSLTRNALTLSGGRGYRPGRRRRWYTTLAPSLDTCPS